MIKQMSFDLFSDETENKDEHLVSETPISVTSDMNINHEITQRAYYLKSFLDVHKDYQPNKDVFFDSLEDEIRCARIQLFAIKQQNKERTNETI